MKTEDELINKIFFKKYRIIKKIGKGSFGMVYIGQQINTEDYYAIKFEPKNQVDLILERESYILYYLRGFGIPEIITYGHNTKYNILVQTLLGKSINNIFFQNFNKFCMKDICMIGIQILDRLEYIHSKYIIHRDIKPDNFLIGNPDVNMIYIIDFGLAKKYMSSRTGKHAKFCINKKWSGTSRFASANSLRGVVQSRRDDLESLCYLLLYLMKGSLPWDNVYGGNENEEILLIYKIKKYMKPEILFLNLPKETVEFFKYCKKLEYEQQPDYNYLRKLLLNILNYSNEKNDLNFSWINKNQSDISSYNNNSEKIEKNKFRRIVKRKNSPRQKLYNCLINKKIDPIQKRSESYNNLNTRNQMNNKVKKDNPIIKYISPNPSQVKFNGLFKNEKNQKYKYIKKIPIGNRKIIIETNNLKKISLNESNKIKNIKTQTETDNVKVGKINIIPLKNVSKISKNAKNKNLVNKIIKEKKIFFQKNLNIPNNNKMQQKNKNSVIRKNNSFNLKESKNMNFFNYILNNSNNNINNNYDDDNSNNINNHDDELTNSIRLRKFFYFNNINKIKNSRSYTKQPNFQRYRSINFNESLNTNYFGLKSVKTFNNNTLYYNRNNLTNMNNMNKLKIDINKYNNNNFNYGRNSLYPIYRNNLNNNNNIDRSNLNIFNRNDDDFRMQERINLTNNNIQNNYNINIDINSQNNKKNIIGNINYHKQKKDIKIINIITPVNKNSYYQKVKKNPITPKVSQINKIKTHLTEKERVKEKEKEKDIFSTLLGENLKNNLFEKYYSNVDVMTKYKKIKDEISFNKKNNKNFFDKKFSENNIKNNNTLVKEDKNSYNEFKRKSYNDVFRACNSLRYKSPKTIQKIKKHKNIY